MVKTDLPFIFNQGHSSCALMGTAAHPAASCSQLHEACQRPSGDYFVIMRGIFTQVKLLREYFLTYKSFHSESFHVFVSFGSCVMF